MRMSIKRRIRHGKDVPFSLDRGQFRVNAPNMIYSAAVFNRRYLPLLIGVIAFAASGSALGQPATSSSASAAGTSSVAAPAVTVGQSAPPSAQADASPAGVVTLEQRGKVIGLGFVLAGDGRIVTALSSLGDGNQIVARFGSGNSVEVKVGHTARAWNIALLVPQSGGTEAGMSASSADPFGAGTRVRGFTRRGKSVAPMPVVLKGKTEMIGGDGEVLKDAIEITTPISLSELGAPLVDGEGHVIGVVSSACKSSDVRSAANCRTVAFGVPMSVIRQFLRSAPAAAARPAPWLGVQGVRTNAQVTGVRVTSVLSGSPAAAANMRAGRNAAATGTGPGAGADTGGDVIVALDGVPIQSTEMLADLVRTKMVGDKVQLIVVRAGRFQVIEAVLTPAPQAGGSGTGGSAGAGAGAQPPPAP